MEFVVSLESHLALIMECKKKKKYAVMKRVLHGAPDLILSEYISNSKCIMIISVYNVKNARLQSS